MPSRRRKRKAGGENASTNVGSNFISDDVDGEDGNHDDNNDDDDNDNDNDNAIRVCPLKNLFVSKSEVGQLLETLKKIDTDAQQDFNNELLGEIKAVYDRSTRDQNAKKSDSFVLEISINTFEHSVCDLQTFQDRIKVMDETAQEFVGVLQFSVVLVAACSSSIGQMFDSSEEAQTLGVLKSEILDMLKKETIQPYKKIVLFVVNFFQTGALLQFLEEDKSRVRLLRTSYSVEDNCCIVDGKRKLFPQIEHGELASENGKFFGIQVTNERFKDMIQKRMNALNNALVREDLHFQFHLRSHAILSLVDDSLGANIIGGFHHPAANLYENVEHTYGELVYEKTNFDVLETPELSDCGIKNRPTIKAQRESAAARTTAEEKLKAYLNLVKTEKVTDERFVLNENQIKVAERMLYEVTRENFASIVNPEPCRSGKTRVTVLVILCLLEWILKIGANTNGKILIISPLTATDAFKETFTSFSGYFHSLGDIVNLCDGDPQNVAKTPIIFVTLQSVSKFKLKKFVLVVVDECHEVYTKSQQKSSKNNEEKIIDVVQNICNDSLLGIFMSGTIITNGFCDVYWLARLMGFDVGNYEYFYQNFSVIISRIFLTDAMTSRNAALYRCQALQQFDKLYAAFLHCIKRVQTPLPTNRFFTFVFPKNDVTRVVGDDGRREYIIYEAVDDHDDAASDKTDKYDGDDDLDSVVDDTVGRGGEGGGEGGGGEDGEDGEDGEGEQPTNDYDCDRAQTNIFQSDPYFRNNFLTMHLKRLHAIAPFAMKHHVENSMHAINVFLDKAGVSEELRKMANKRLKIFRRLLKNCSTERLENSLSATIRVNIVIDRILHFVDGEKVKVVVTCDSVELLHAFARNLKEKSETLQKYGESILFLTSEDAPDTKDRNDIIDQFRTDAQSYVLFASQIGSAGVSFAPASVLFKLDVGYKTHLEEQSSYRCSRLPNSDNANNDDNAGENRHEIVVTSINSSTRVFLNELLAGLNNFSGAGRRDGSSYMEIVKDAENITLMNQATRQINGTAAYDIQQEYVKNLYAICKQKYGNCVTEETYGDERMATLHMNEEQFLKAISATPMPPGAKKQIRIKSNNSSGVGGGDDRVGGGGGGGGRGGRGGRGCGLPKMRDSDSGLGYTIPYSNDGKTVENSLWGVLESIRNARWNDDNDVSRKSIQNEIEAHNVGVASVAVYEISIQTILTISNGTDAMKENFKKLADHGYPLKCKHKSEVWENWRKNIASASRHDKTKLTMFEEPTVNSRMMIGVACEKTALLALCKEKKLKIVSEYSGFSFMHQKYNVSYSPDAVVYSETDEKLYVVEIKTSSNLTSSALLGTSQRMRSGRIQLKYGMHLLNICRSGILVDFVLDEKTKRQSMRIEYFDIDSTVYTFINGRRTSTDPETWFEGWHKHCEKDRKEFFEEWQTTRGSVNLLDGSNL